MSHASVVPERAEPRNRTRDKGVRKPDGVSTMRVSTSPDGVADRPDDDCQNEAADQGRPGQLISHRRVHAVASVPDEMPNAADEVVKEGPGEAEQDEPANERL